MPWFDLPLEQLRQYRTETEEPPELDKWWQLRLAQALGQAREPGPIRYKSDIYTPVEVYDAEFSGAGGDRIRAWYLRPAGADGRTPVVVKFVGYGGGRGLPTEHALLPALGYSVFVMDTRGQGGRWTTGETRDHPEGQPGGPRECPGHDQGNRAAGRLLLHPPVHRRRDGGRRGPRTDGRAPGRGERQQPGWGPRAGRRRPGPEQVAVCHADVPFLCDIQRAITLAPEAPYTEVPEFLAHQLDLIPAALDTLRYVDCALLARRITARCLLSVGLMDTICPPSTVFAAYNEITAAKDIWSTRSLVTRSRPRTSNASSGTSGSSSKRPAAGPERNAFQRPTELIIRRFVLVMCYISQQIAPGEVPRD